MRNKVVAKRYAEGYIDYAKPRIGLRQCVDEMKGLRWILRENPSFGVLLRAPEVNETEKYAVIDRVFSGRYSEEFTTFLKYLIGRGRFEAVNEIAEYIRRLYDHGEALDVVLRTTFPLELDLVEKIKSRLEKKNARKVNLYLELDPDLLGGVQIVVGNTVVDGSVKNKLSQLRKQLLKAQVTR